MRHTGLTIGVARAAAVCGVLGFIALPPAPARAHGEQTPGAARRNGHGHGVSAKQNLVDVVREATRRYHDVAAAEAAGYTLMFGCVSGPDAGAMGLHYVNPSLLGDGILDPARPEIIIYEPLPNGGRRLIGADFLELKDVWDTAHPTDPPQLMGQLLHLFEAPNRFGLPAFYTLHVWAWKENPAGAFVNWHLNVKCEAFSGSTH